MLNDIDAHIVPTASLGGIKGKIKNLFGYRIQTDGCSHGNITSKFTRRCNAPVSMNDPIPDNNNPYIAI
jgi:hypothetical protein